jgi:hypothetical protein
VVQSDALLDEALSPVGRVARLDADRRSGTD